MYSPAARVGALPRRRRRGPDFSLGVLAIYLSYPTVPSLRGIALTADLSHRRIWQLAWPIILANSAIPLLGLVDTAIIGHNGAEADLGAIALGALIFSFAYWSFGFLRMGTTGFAARASGAGDQAEVRATLGRALLLAALIGIGLILLQRPLALLAFKLLGASAAVEDGARLYFQIRIWGAPASLGTFAVMGLLIGLARTREILWVQLFLNGLNIGLDWLFAGILGWGVAGIALGTAIAEWCSLALALILAWRALRAAHDDDQPFWPLARIRDPNRLRAMLTANADIMLRTLLLLFSFAWFINQAATFGDTVLAATHILLQFISLAAYFLDGYAHAAEPLVGGALGRHDLAHFDRAIRRSTELAGLTAALLAGILLLGGETLIHLLTDLPAVQAAASDFLPHCAAYVLCSFAAFQLDGIYIGAGWTGAMRNAAILSTATFLVAAWPLGAALGAGGLWLAFIAYVLARAVPLAAWLPRLRREAGGPNALH